MAKVTLNPVLEAIHGKVGDLVFRRIEGEEFVGRIPDRTGIVPTVNQIAQQEKFRLATVYGKAVLADPQTRAIYEDAAERRGLPVFAVSVGDFLNVPVVEEINLSAYTGKTDEVIRIRASDDVSVQGVALVIRAQDGSVLEQGAAVWSPATGSWIYTTTTNLQQGQAVSIEVSATDRPGHQTVKVQARS